MPPGVAGREQGGMGEKERSDREAEAPMQPVQAVASHGRFDPRQAADEHQLKEHSRGDQEPRQPAERDGETAFAIEQKAARAMPPRDAKGHNVNQAGHGEPLRRCDGSRAVPSQGSSVAPFAV
jgi:hypothetical protein